MRLQIVKPVAKNGLRIVRAYFRNSFREFEEVVGDVVFNGHTSGYTIISD